MRGRGTAHVKNTMHRQCQFQGGKNREKSTIFSGSHFGIRGGFGNIYRPDFAQRRLRLVGGSGLDEYAAGWSDSHAFGLSLVVAVANRLVSGGAVVQSGFDLLALTEIEM